MRDNWSNPHSFQCFSIIFRTPNYPGTRCSPKCPFNANWAGPVVTMKHKAKQWLAGKTLALSSWHIPNVHENWGFFIAQHTQHHFLQSQFYPFYWGCYTAFNKEGLQWVLPGFTYRFDHIWGFFFADSPPFFHLACSVSHPKKLKGCCRSGQSPGGAVRSREQTLGLTAKECCYRIGQTASSPELSRG